MSGPGRVAGETRPCQGFSSSRLTPFLRGRASGWPGPLLNGFHRPRSRKGLPRLRAGRGWWRPRGGVRVCVTTGGGAPRGKAGLSRGCFSLLFWRASSVFTAALRLSAHRGGRGRHQLPAPVCVRKVSPPGHPQGLRSCVDLLPTASSAPNKTASSLPSFAQRSPRKPLRERT